MTVWSCMRAAICVHIKAAISSNLTAFQIKLISGSFMEHTSTKRACLGDLRLCQYVLHNIDYGDTFIQPQKLGTKFHLSVLFLSPKLQCHLCHSCRPGLAVVSFHWRCSWLMEPAAAGCEKPPSIPHAGRVTWWGQRQSALRRSCGRTTAQHRVQDWLGGNLAIGMWLHMDHLLVVAGPGHWARRPPGGRTCTPGW